MRWTRLCAGLPSFLLALAPLAAQPLPLGADFTVNATTALDQVRPDIAADGVDRFRVVWQTQVGDPVHGDVRTRPISAAGSLGSDTLLSQTTSGNQFWPAVALSAGGDWVVVWVSDHDGVPGDLYRRYTTGGGTFITAEETVGTESDTETHEPSVATIAEDAFVVAWRNQPALAQVRGDFGLRSGLNFANSTLGNGSLDTLSSVAGFADEGWVGIWHAPEPVAGLGVYARCFSNRFPTENAFLVHASDPADQRTGRVAASADGRFVVAWKSGNGIRARLFRGDDLGCAPIGDEIEVSDPAHAAAFPRVDMAEDGAFVVAWQTFEFEGDAGVAAREYTKDGLAVGAPFAVNSVTLGPQTTPVVAVSATRFVGAWVSPDAGVASPSNIRARRFARRVVFTDGFEFGDREAWTSEVP
jgi:hypothetical protein